MKKAYQVTIALYLTMTSSLYGLELIDESAIESLDQCHMKNMIRDMDYGILQTWNFL